MNVHEVEKLTKEALGRHNAVHFSQPELQSVNEFIGPELLKSTSFLALMEELEESFGVQCAVYKAAGCLQKQTRT